MADEGISNYNKIVAGVAIVNWALGA